MRMRSLIVWFLVAVICAPFSVQADDLGPHMGLTKGSVLTGRFVHEHPVQGFQKPLRSEGHFTVMPNEQIIWSIEKPMATTTTITPEGLVQSVGTYQLMRLGAAQMPFLTEVQSKLILALNGDWATLSKSYKIKRTGKPEAWTVAFSWRDDDATTPKPFQKIIARGANDKLTSADVVLRNAVDHVEFYDLEVKKNESP